MSSSIRGTANIAVQRILSLADYHQPMKDDLLWVYEGLTEYLGEVLTARSGLLESGASARSTSPDLAATYDNEPGRNWRPLQDTADAAVFLYDADMDWENWRRGTDFYEEGELLWLDVDATLRRLTGGQEVHERFLPELSRRARAANPI